MAGCAGISFEPPGLLKRSAAKTAMSDLLSAADAARLGWHVAGGPRADVHRRIACWDMFLRHGHASATREPDAADFGCVETTSGLATKTAVRPFDAWIVSAATDTPA